MFAINSFYINNNKRKTAKFLSVDKYKLLDNFCLCNLCYIEYLIIYINLKDLVEDQIQIEKF